MLDARSGSWVGKLTAPEPPLEILRAGFHPAAGELAAIVRYQGRREIVFWDLVTGQVNDQFALNDGTVGPAWDEQTHAFHRQIGLDYRRSGYLTLDDLYLIDRRRRTTPWRYNLRQGKHGVRSPDDREWFAQLVKRDANGQVFDWVLDAVQLPSDAVLDLLRAASPQPLQPPVGSSVLTLAGEETTRN